MPLTDRGCWGVTRPEDLVALCGDSNYNVCTKTACKTEHSITTNALRPGALN
jgi:hypothetical protein